MGKGLQLQQLLCLHRQRRYKSKVCVPKRENMNASRRGSLDT
jgi:hypothetical protein